jgi:hypothetical protein
MALMTVWITLEASAPPSGHIRIGAQQEGLSAELPAIPFVGWLDLLRALADVVGDPRQQGTSPRIEPGAS